MAFPPRDKAWRQLLCFTLSALALLGGLDEDPLRDLVEEQLPSDLGDGTAPDGGTGRSSAVRQIKAMFLAIFLLHARDRLGRDTTADLGTLAPAASPVHEPVRLLGAGGWSDAPAFPERLIINTRFSSISTPTIRPSSRRFGSSRRWPTHWVIFAPYPGGGACFDYDAVFVLTAGGKAPEDEALRAPPAAHGRQHRGRAAAGWRVLREPSGPSAPDRPAWFRRAPGQRPQSCAVLRNGCAYAVTLQRSKHDRIHTHWSRYQRR